MDTAASVDSDTNKGGVLSHLEEMSDDIKRQREARKDVYANGKAEEAKVGKDKHKVDIEPGKELEHAVGEK